MRTILKSSPEGNAFVVMGIAKNIGKQLEQAEIWEKGQTDLLIAEMMSDDYENLCEVFNRTFIPLGIAKVLDDTEDYSEEDEWVDEG